jgi:small-conductance mechanosensitive channel
MAAIARITAYNNEMNILESLLHHAARFLPAIITLIIFSALIWWLVHFTNKRQALADYRRTLAPQFLMVALAVIGLLIFSLTLPFSDTTRGQVVTLVGVILTGIIAISSTTFVTNAMAGLMLRWIRHFKAGDFIEVNGLFGRITERGLFHTEIQNEERDLITFPNLYLIANPTTVIRSSGTIISASLSLGYDIAHQRIEDLLQKAARETGLTEAFVHITELGDFSVGYKISGFLTETKQLLSARSNLKRNILDVLHLADIEIVSPNFMNQRVLHEKATIIPQKIGAQKMPAATRTAAPESVMFDKAESAEEMDQWQERHDGLAKKLEELKKGNDEAEQTQVKLIEEEMTRIKQKMEAYLQAQKTDEGLEGKVEPSRTDR